MRQIDLEWRHLERGVSTCVRHESLPETLIRQALCRVAVCC